MRKALLTLVLLLGGLQFVSHVYAAYTDSFVIDNNKLMAGTFNFQMSITDTNQDGIADPEGFNWTSTHSSLWSTPDDWAPNQTVGKTVFIRSTGTLDMGDIKFKVTRAGASGLPVDEHIVLETAWYDHNGDGVKDPEDDLLPKMNEYFDDNEDNKVTLAEVTALNGKSVPLELNGTVLPGKKTNDQLGGSTGTGKGLTLEWKLKNTVPVEYGGSYVMMNVEVMNNYVPVEAI